MASLQSATFDGNLTVSSKINLQQIFEKVSIVSTPATGTINIDLLSQAMYLYSSAATANWILNVRGNSSTTLDSVLAVGETISFAMINNTGTTPRYPSSFRIDGTEIRVKWYDGLDPSSINLVGNSFDVYNFMIIKRAVSTYTVIGSYGKYA